MWGGEAFCTPVMASGFQRAPGCDPTRLLSHHLELFIISPQLRWDRDARGAGVGVSHPVGQFGSERTPGS